MARFQFFAGDRRLTDRRTKPIASCWSQVVSFPDPDFSEGGLGTRLGLKVGYPYHDPALTVNQLCVLLFGKY